MTATYSPGEVDALADVMAEARLAGMVTGTRRMARHLLDAGYRTGRDEAVDRALELAAENERLRRDHRAAYGRGRDDEAAGMSIPVEMR